ncbi:anthranilate phosphoribosyltransferase [bacterium endosymbiont of Bathymodiolus sp. 5 South]|jgi:anthranilate phosphoribosyltransferase|uniref:anthranilate phosphoribosyltransferase n=1 Tax=bacterium endosymbiont of Bathymodiolus sp. 5 South TaxID=1181670 RepID=UPI0010B4FCBB|nr:anthranilate phosphoribosyltransferase [bacterium endosymbiont of Bathymodiolus sp. 5 South]VVH55999.1 Anthranilate phosphoribosyltransferase like (EC [uncultured Gammaproteobacteria bacterium]SHN90955.1 Anthranilate phosphoribosyltransferase like [bacterium endosymbiont of Bathymodiolus sp. 5 South]SSC07882.1 Anthranilate phosphoribosyltransferase [bacterium endosymbiont of Bathymodiolus sp. 5 South]VVH63083.1 Anthranilate phosphoribosyltransferase like (EC [uncultured Gammaproteobacteria b
MNSQDLMKSIIQRVATGPDLSKDIAFEEARDGMQAILRGEIDDVRSAIFLIALRMKRESMEENEGILAAILAQSDKQQINVEDLVDLGDPYSGYNRSIPISSFLPPLLAELGLPTIIHGLDSVSPKFGLTHRHINQALGLNVDCSTEQAKNRLEDSSIGWSYVDQASYCSGLHDLVPLRERLIKRSVINTVETLIGPLRGKTTHSILGYVHKPYPPIYAHLVDASGMDSALLVRGVEGGVIPSLRQKGLMVSYQGLIEQDRVDINPKSLGIDQNLRAISFPDKWDVHSDIKALADYTVELGKSALSGDKGLFYDGLVLAASLILWHTKKADSLVGAAEMTRAILNSGRALNRL